MAWLRANYDRAAAIAGAIFLILCASFIFLSASGFSERFGALQNVPAPDHKIPAGRVAEIVEAMQQLQAPAQWTARAGSGLFVPEKHFIGTDGQPATLQNTVLHPPVPNDWLEEFGLPITEPDVLTQDADGDGFTNLDEWEHRSNPSDAGSHPPYLTKLKLRSFAREAFPLIFASSIGDTYAVNHVDPTRPTQFLRLGDLVAGTQYKLTAYSAKHDVDKYGTTIDVSELTLEQVVTHDRVTLVKGQWTTSPDSVARFAYSWNGTEEAFSVKKGWEFSLKPQEEIKYRLLDVRPDEAIIINIRKPHEKILIGSL